MDAFLNYFLVQTRTTYIYFNICSNKVNHFLFQTLYYLCFFIIYTLQPCHTSNAMDKIWHIIDERVVTVVLKIDVTIIDCTKNTTVGKPCFAVFGVAVVEWGWGSLFSSRQIQHKHRTPWRLFAKKTGYT